MHAHHRHPVVLALLGAILAGGCGGEDPPVASAVRTPAPVPLATARPAAIVEARPTAPLPPGTSCVSAGCHANFEESRFVHGVVRSKDGCAVCHADDEGGHVYPLKRPGPEGCTFCHESVVGQRIHQHAATDVDCTSCHDPHASAHVSLLRSASVATLCASCHPDAHPTQPHAPFASRECVACHDPHESDFEGLLRGGEGPAHCALCHDGSFDQIEKAAFVHAPAAEGCQSCHLPHGSDHPFGLGAPIGESCYACHEDIEQMVAGAEAPHGALVLDDQCANCHDPHASDYPGLLKDRQDVLCMQCHDRPLVAADGRKIADMTEAIDREFLHGPVATGQCTACHNVQ